MLNIVIIIFAAIITPKPQKKGQAEFGGATHAVVLNLVQDLVFLN